MENKGKKLDQGKPDFTLLPFDALEQVVHVLDFGAAKYGRDNWQNVGDSEQRYLAAALRHIAAHLQGSKVDPESDLPHLAHATCSLLFVLATERSQTRAPYIPERDEE